MSERKTFQEVIERTIEVIGAFRKVEKKEWGVEGAMIELSKQVGDLAKRVMSIEGYYLSGRDASPEYESSKEKIADELSDILFVCIRIANHYGIDLEDEHMRQMDIAMNHPHMKIGRKESEEVVMEHL